MNIKDSPEAYGDVAPVMDMALEKPGLTVEFDSSGKAINFKQRCNQYRKMLRDRDSEMIGPIPGHRSITPYDGLVIRQINAEGLSSRYGRLVLFEHRNQGDFKIIDPETQEEIKITPPSLFD